jgi:glycosyltransferase 2 family protein
MQHVITTINQIWAQKRLRQALQISWFVLIGLFILMAIASSWDSIRALEWTPTRLISLVIALVITLLRKFTGGIRWAWIIQLLGKEKMNFAQSLRVFFISGLAAWLPGTYWFIPGRIIMNSKQGVTTLQTSVSILLEQFLIIISGGLMAIFAFDLIADALEVPVASFWWVLLVIAGGLVAIHPRVLHFCTNLMARVLRMQSVTIELGYGMMLALLLWSIVVWVLSGLSLLFLSQVFVPSINLQQTGVFTAIFAFSFLVGYFTPFAPNGLGVREGILGLALGALGVPAGIIVIIAALSRLLIIFEDLFWAAFSSLIFRQEQTTHA